MKPQEPSLQFVPSAELAELHRDVFNFLAHELGGISSALGLRADAMTLALPGPDQAALQGMSDQLRDVYRLLRLMEAPRGESFLAPSRSTTGAEWWRVCGKMLDASLPRSVVLKPALDGVELLPRHAHLLTILTLLACRDLRERRVTGPATVAYSLSPRIPSELGVVAELSLVNADWPEGKETRRTARWQRYAARVASKAGVELEWWVPMGERVRWRCTI